MMDEREGVAPALPATDEGVLKTKLALEAADPEKPINVLTGNDDVPNFQRDWDASNMSVWDEVKAELNLVKRTFYYVLYQWTQLPSRL